MKRRKTKRRRGKLQFFREKKKTNTATAWAVVVVQLVERSLPTPEVRGSNPVIGKIYIEQLLTVNCVLVEKTKIKQKRGREWPIFKNTGIATPESCDRQHTKKIWMQIDLNKQLKLTYTYYLKQSSNVFFIILQIKEIPANYELKPRYLSYQYNLPSYYSSTSTYEYFMCYEKVIRHLQTLSWTESWLLIQIFGIQTT